MQRRNHELWLALLTILLITLLYLYRVNQLGEIPAARGFWGHGLGIFGFFLMLMTEILYSWRKRSPRARWGRMASWLRIHIFMGLVGPYMILLHSSWRFNGLAGIVMLLTIVIVISGVIGRYIYTAIPRTVDGAEIEAAELTRQITLIEEKIKKLESLQPEPFLTLRKAIRSSSISPNNPLQFFLNRISIDLKERFEFWRLRRIIKPGYRTEVDAMVDLFKRKIHLQRQASSLIMARQLLSLWHAVHIPLGMILFATAFIHIVGAIYYATLLR